VQCQKRPRSFQHAGLDGYLLMRLKLKVRLPKCLGCSPLVGWRGKKGFKKREWSASGGGPLTLALRSSLPGDVSLSLRVPRDLVGCGVRENNTTRPPASPVAKYCPDWSNSTHVKQSASFVVFSAPKL